MKSPNHVFDDVPCRYLAKIERSDYPRRILFWAFRRWILNEDYFAVTTRFSGPRPRMTNQVSTLKSNATAFRIYIDRRATVGYAEQMKRLERELKWRRQEIALRDHLRPLRVAS
jgi:hypothetical protein